MKKICVIMTGFHSEYARMTAQGMSDQAAALGYSLFFHSYYGHSDPTVKIYFGETNIIDLISAGDFDAFIIQPGVIHDEGVRRKIRKTAFESGRPVLDFDRFCSPDQHNGIWADRENFRLLTEHLLDVHGLTNIWYIGGPKGDPYSEYRLLGYRDAMDSHGIEISDDMIFYGDFWKDHAIKLADMIADGKLPRPQAIACAATVPAAMLIERLTDRGIRVPQDIAVTGYDRFIIGELCTPSVTYASSPNYNQGVLAIIKVHEMLTGRKAESVPLQPVCIFPSGSCGCFGNNDSIMRRMKTDLLEQLARDDLFRNSGMQETLSTAEDLQDLLTRLTRVEYLIRGLHTIHYFICDDWDSMNGQAEAAYRSCGYSDRLIVHTHSPLTSGSRCLLHRKDITEYLSDGGGAYAYYLFPIHYEDRAFGFIALRLTESRYVPDSLLWNWLQIVGNSLEMLRIRSYLTRFSMRRHLAAVRDNLTGLYNKRGFEELSAEMYEYAVLHHEKLLLCVIRLYHISEASRELGFEVINDAVTAVSGVLSRYRKGNEQFCRTEQGVFWIVGSSSEEEYFADYSGRAFIEECRKQLLTIDEKNTIQPEMAVFYEYTGDRPLESLVKTLEFKLSKKHLNDRRHTFHIHNIHDLRTELYRHPEQKWSIEQMAQTVMLSRTHFQRIYRQTFGISASADLINARIKHAKELLLLGNSITVTAELCGYSSGDYFMHQFKKMTGMTPSEWLDGKRNVYSDPTV